ncbi:MAG: type II secretion system protein [Phycisphaerales bacterium]|nr:type II secretion system protein [Phycisphaerales bacterium]
MSHTKHFESRFVNRSGFTLIELLVSVGIISLLIGLLVPALGKARSQAQELASSVNLRSIGQVYEMYLGSSKGLYPAPIPGRFYPDPNPHMGRATMGHWQASDFWSNLFFETYPWAENKQMYLAPGAERDLSMQPVIITTVPSFQYSASFLGQPKIWSEEDFPSTEWAQLERSVRQSMVRYPSAKALMWDVEMPYIRRPLERDGFFNLLEKTPILFADQHVENRIPAEANPGVTNWATYAAHPHPFLHNTRDGVFGRDY